MLPGQGLPVNGASISYRKFFICCFDLINRLFRRSMHNAQPEHEFASITPAAVQSLNLGLYKRFPYGGLHWGNILNPESSKYSPTLRVSPFNSRAVYLEDDSASNHFTTNHRRTPPKTMVTFNSWRPQKLVVHGFTRNSRGPFKSVKAPASRRVARSVSKLFNPGSVCSKMVSPQCR